MSTTQEAAPPAGTLQQWSCADTGPTGHTGMCAIDAQGREWASGAQVLVIEPDNDDIAVNAFAGALLSHALSIGERDVEDGGDISQSAVAVWADSAQAKTDWYQRLSRVRSVRGCGRRDDGTQWDANAREPAQRVLRANEPMGELWLGVHIDADAEGGERDVLLRSEVGVGADANETLTVAVPATHGWDVQSLAWWLDRALCEGRNRGWAQATALAARALGGAQGEREMTLAVAIDTALRHAARGRVLRIEWDGHSPVRIEPHDGCAVRAIRSDG